MFYRNISTLYAWTQTDIDLGGERGGVFIKHPDNVGLGWRDGDGEVTWEMGSC
jgi:hypothetical protein